MKIIRTVVSILLLSVLLMGCMSNESTNKEDKTDIKLNTMTFSETNSTLQIDLPYALTDVRDIKQELKPNSDFSSLYDNILYHKVYGKSNRELVQVTIIVIGADYEKIANDVNIDWKPDTEGWADKDKATIFRKADNSNGKIASYNRQDIPINGRNLIVDTYAIQDANNQVPDTIIENIYISNDLSDSWAISLIYSATNKLAAEQADNILNSINIK